MASAEVKSMTLTYREMQQPRNKELFRLEFAGRFNQQQTPDDLRSIVMGKQCQKI